MSNRLSRRQALSRLGTLGAGLAALSIPGGATAHHRPDHSQGQGRRGPPSADPEPPDSERAPEPDPQPEPPPANRDPFLWPFDRFSPWNHPLGTGASYSDARDPITRDLRAGHRNSTVNIEHWTIANYQAEGPSRDIYIDGRRVASLHVPDEAHPSTPLVDGDSIAERDGLETSSWADAHLNIADGTTLYEMYRATRLPDMSIEASYGLQEHDLTGSGIGAYPGDWSGTRAYGGSSLGGLIRLWELEAGNIPHALAVGIPASSLKNGWVWPATLEDGGGDNGYSGQVPMGTLAAIPPSVDVESLSYSSSHGPTVARALQLYGAYVVDTAGSSGMRFYGEFPGLYEMFPWSEVSALNEDVQMLVAHLLAVVNNGPDRIGGGGDPLAPFAPDFA